MGVQVVASWTRRWRRLQFQAVASSSMNYNRIAAEQFVSMGDGITPGQLNRPLYFPEVDAKHELEADDFSPQHELGLRGSFFLSPSLQIYAGVDCLALYDIHFASNSIVYRLPDMGLVDRGGFDLFGYLGSV